MIEPGEFRGSLTSALEQTKPAWRDAYLRRGERQEALVLLASALLVDG